MQNGSHLAKNGFHLSPGGALRHAAGRGAPSRERRHIGRLIGILYLAGAMLGGTSLLLPRDPSHDQALAAITLGAFLVGAALVIFHRRVTLWMSHAITAMAAVLISLAVYFSGDSGSVYALMFVWAVLLAAYFFPPRLMAAHLAWMLGAYGAALALLAGPQQTFSPLTRWLLTAIALGVTGWLTSWLVARRREAEQAYRHLAAIIDSAQDAVVGVALDGTIVSWNEGSERLYGYAADEAIGRPSSMLSPPDRSDEISAIQARVLAGEAVEHYETVRRRGDGRLVEVSLSVSRICDDDGEVVGVSAAARDITGRRQLELDRAQLLAQVRALARTDSLTELANRRAWDGELDRELARAARHAAPIAVAMLDLDRFKRFNDEHGHLAGDDLLKRAAESWRSELRNSDFIARYGGEEFAVLLPDCSLDEACETLERLRQAVPMGQSCSAGLAIWDGLESGARLTRRADAALYEAKRTGRDRVVVAPEPAARVAVSS